MIARNNQLSDATLINNYIGGDSVALGVLLDRHRSKILNYIKLFIKDQDTAEDILQEVFIKIFSFLKEDKYKDDGKFIQWAMRIAHNKIIDYFRLNRSQKNVSIDDEERGPILHDTSLIEHNIEDEMIEDQIRLDVRNLVDRLPLEQREVVILRHYLDLSFKEIAEQTGVSINTALGRMRYALINLRKMIETNNITIDMSYLS